MDGNSGNDDIDEMRWPWRSNESEIGRSRYGWRNEWEIWFQRRSNAWQKERLV